MILNGIGGVGGGGGGVFFFFKQKTAYEMLRSLVGSEMCIRDSIGTCGDRADIDHRSAVHDRSRYLDPAHRVQHTHLALSLIHL